MAIQSTDLHWRFSVTSGTQGNTLPQPTPDLSLGKYISQTDWPAASLGDLFDNINGGDNDSGEVDYRCLFLYNTHGTLTLTSPVIWIQTHSATNTAIAIGVDPTTVSPVGSVSQQAVATTDDDTAPAGVAFSSPTTQMFGLPLGDIPPGQCKAFWIRRTALNNGPLNNDLATFEVAGSTAA